MMNALTDLSEEFKSFLNAQFLFIAVPGDGPALNIFHDEVGSSGRSYPRRIHGQYWDAPAQLKFDARPRNEQQPFCVHAEFDDLQSNFAFDRFLLLS
jgi:hypothetical protein